MGQGLPGGLQSNHAAGLRAWGSFCGLWRLNFKVPTSFSCEGEMGLYIDPCIIHFMSMQFLYSAAVKNIFVVAAKRTPFGTYGGKLMNQTATDLQEVAARAALASAEIKPEIIESVIIGNALHVRLLLSSDILD